MILKKHKKSSSSSKRISLFKCLDGHIVRSKGELIIDNYLYLQGVEHKYESIIRINGQVIKCDWYLPQSDVYIEYWGYFGKKYEKRKAIKLYLYSKAKLNLISIENEMFNDIYHALQEKLKKYINLNQSIFQTSLIHCSNCGIKLDERYNIID
ncbi:MAG: hypothetical protein ACFFAS_01245 [Promethearchaeota archaeon]